MTNTYKGGKRRWDTYYDWIEDEICDFARDKGLEFDEVIFPWKGNPEWDPKTFARKDLTAVLKDKNGQAVGKVRFRIVVNPRYGETYEYLWKLDSLRVSLKEGIEIKEKMVEERTWEEFRAHGLILHLFGWAIAYRYEEESGQLKAVFPARVKFRGFTEEITTRGYIRVTEYLKRNIDKLLEEAKS